MELIDKKMIDGLAEELGLGFLAEEKRDEMMEKIVELITKRAGLKIMESLSEEEAKEFNQIAKGDIKEVEKFLLAKVPDVKNLFVEEMEAVKKEMLEFRGN